MRPIGFSATRYAPAGGRVRQDGMDAAANPAIPGNSKIIRFSGRVQAGSGTLGPTAVQLFFAGKQRKLMSYNAHRLDNKVDKNGNEIKPVASIQALADVILKEDPDVVALQEVLDRGVLTWLNNKFLQRKYPHIIMFPSPNHSQMNVAIMSKSNIRVVDAKSHWKDMAQGRKHYRGRDFLEATFETETGYRFTVFNGHFKSMHGGEKRTHPIRMLEARNASRIVGSFLKRYPPAPVFVTGDFNFKSDTALGKEVQKILSLRTDTNPANDLTEVMLKDGKTEPTNRTRGFPDTKLDYTFTNQTMLKQVRKAYVSGDFDQAPWKDASDHLPLVTVFEEPDPVQPVSNPSRLYFAGGHASAKTWIA